MLLDNQFTSDDALLDLREDAHAQWEIQEYARAIRSLLTPYFPVCLSLGQEGQAQPSSADK